MWEGESQFNFSGFISKDLMLHQFECDQTYWTIHLLRRCFGHVCNIISDDVILLSFKWQNEVGRIVMHITRPDSGEKLWKSVSTARQ